jgi:hypothetical protein
VFVSYSKKGPKRTKPRAMGAWGCHGMPLPACPAEGPIQYGFIYAIWRGGGAARRARADTAVIRLTFMSQVRALRYATHPDPSTRPNEIANTHNDICGCNVTSQITRHEERPSLMSMRDTDTH